MSKKKIAVIGGGMSSMATVYEILKADNWQSNYDITVYQLGWRIGGKGASGRNADEYQRIEEHGLHMWFGMYNNAFNLIMNVYDKLNRPEGHPLRTWEDAFKPHNKVVGMEYFNQKWNMYEVELPMNDVAPGGDQVFLPISAYIKMILDLLHIQLSDSDYHNNHASHKEGLAKSILHWIEDGVEKLTINAIRSMLEEAIELVEKHEENIHNSRHDSHVEVKSKLKSFIQEIRNDLGDLLSHNKTTRCLFEMLDLGIATVVGVLEDQLIYNGFDSVNKYDLQEWLMMHGATEMSVKSTFLTGAYNALFAYEFGDTEQPNMEAGTSLKAAILAMGIKTAPVWKMQAGMGDTIFTPIYQLFKQHRVKFEFFNKVRNIGLNDAGDSIEKITIERQATLKPGLKEYDPLVMVKGLECWPSEPQFNQLVEGEELKAKGINLESSWSDWEGEQFDITVGKDFDIVLYGAAVGTFPHIAKEILAAQPHMTKMVHGIKTTQTIAMQTWMNKTAKDLGYKHDAQIIGSYEQPLDTWAIMDQLIDKEEWPAEFSIDNVSYFCGPFKDIGPVPPFSDHSFPKYMKGLARENALKYLTDYTKPIWPDAIDPDGEFDWNILVDKKDRQGSDRVDSQYYRTNYDPTERYTLTVKGSSVERLRSEESGIDNMYMTGDWTQCGMNLGCIESCSMSGILAARAITGMEIKLVGEEIVFMKPYKDKYEYEVSNI